MQKKEMPSTRRREDGAKKERTDIEKKNKHREKNGTGRGPEIRKRHIMREKFRRGATMAQFLIPIYR
jgi:hypothetical protein